LEVGKIFRRRYSLLSEYKYLVGSSPLRGRSAFHITKEHPGFSAKNNNSRVRFENSAVFNFDEQICEFMFDFIVLLAKLDMIPFVGQPILQGGRHNETGYQRDQG
jgi:hypothetical protein